MKSRALLVIATCVLVSGLPNHALAAWEPAAFTGEGRRTVQGCAARFTDESFMCVLIRCDRANQLGLYVIAAGLNALGSVTFSVDRSVFPVTIATTPNSPIPDAHRASDFPVGLRTAMKSGRVLRILGANLTPRYDIVSLKGAGPAIGRIEKGCGVSGDDPAR